MRTSGIWLSNTKPLEYSSCSSLFSLRSWAGIRTPSSNAFATLPHIQVHPFSHILSGPMSFIVTLSGRVPMSLGFSDVFTWYSSPSAVPLRICITLLRWNIESLLFSDVVQHNAIRLSPINMLSVTQLPNALRTTHDRLDPPHNDSNSFFGIVPFGGARSPLPIMCWEDQVPSRFWKLPQQPIISETSAASTAVINLMFEFKASSGILGRLNCIPLNCSTFQRFSTHLFRRLLHMASSQDWVANTTLRKSALRPMVMGAYFPRTS